jgi:hypothetical protein
MALRAAHSPRNWITARAASRRVLARTGASRTQSGNDVRTTSPPLRGELRLTLDTLSHYSPVFIARLAINSLRRRVQFFSERSRALRRFVRVVESGSFSAVARELGVGSPPLTSR